MEEAEIKVKKLDNGTCFTRKKYPEKFSTRLEQTEFLYEEVHATKSPLSG